jgi:hypothetical protein
MILKKVRKGIKALDFFGYRPILKYKGKSDHRTLIGGFLSGLLRAFLSYFVITKVLRLALHGEDSISVISDGVNVDSKVINVL